MIRVAILDDSRLGREGLAQIIASDPSLVAGGAGDAAEIHELLRSSSAEILLANAQAEGALTLCAELGRNGRRPWVILFAAEPGDDWAVRALEMGARGLLAKSASADELLKAIRVVHEGQIWTRRDVVAQIVQKVVTFAAAADAEKKFLAQSLSGREQQVVQQTARGLSNDEIAERLHISEATVKAHLSRIFHKLGVRDRGQLVALYHQAVHSAPPSSANPKIGVVEKRP